ncbi:MAG: PilN domain-containing protein [Acidobacteriota bacterium]
MIRVNLLAVERRVAKRAGTFDAAQKITVACSAVLIVAALFVGWRYWALQQESKQLDQGIADARQETARLRTILQQVEAFEQQKAQLQERVALIEQLRKSQSGPVHMLDQISRALPPMLWLTQLKQTDDAVVIDGRCTALTGLSDFVANLEASGYFRKSIEIVSSQTEALPAPPGELVKFSIKAQFQQPGGGPKS